METKTIGQLNSISNPTSGDLVEAESLGISGKLTLSQIAALSRPCGEIFDMAYKKTISSDFPAVALWESDQTISATNYPVLVPELRSAAAEVKLTAGTIVTSINCNATGGSILSSVDSAFTIMVNALAEEYAIQAAYSIAVTIGGTEYTIASVSSTITISGTIATGATTLSVYPHRIVGTSNSAIVFCDSGRATLTHDGNTRLAGLRRRNRMQGFQVGSTADGTGARNLFGVLDTRDYRASTSALANNAPPIYDTTSQGATNKITAVSDGVNGIPRTGPNTEPDSNVVYRYMWAQVYV